MRTSLLSLLVFAVTSASALAHVTVAPQQSQIGASQIYKVRIHNEGKVPTKSIELAIPDGVTVISVEKPAAGSFDTTKAADGRITAITWQIEVQPGKFVELPFTVKNPPAASQVRWNLREVLADGQGVDWNGAKGSITKIGAAAAPAAAPAAAHEH